ncbi:MAG: hypothetical protein JWN34_2896 [Bryobacterales bacterium]|nr:hypothetical protein [Bryobacterales bacterium]
MPSFHSISEAPAYVLRVPTSFTRFSVVLTFVLLLHGKLSAQDLNLSPTRPTVANSVTIQDKGVLQVETGYDAFPQHSSGNQHTVAASLYYVPLKRLRLDFGWSPFSHQEGDDGTVNGVGTIQLGGKVVLVNEEHSRAKPGVAVQYEAQLPTASDQVLQGFGQQIILLLNHHYGPNGVIDVIVNGSLVQSDCQTRSGCRYGGQQSFALSYHIDPKTRLYAEVFGQNISQSNAPPGTYAFGGFYHRFSDSFGLNGGMRFGLTNHSATIGSTIGVVFGRRIH